MAKNHLAMQLKTVKENAYANGVMDGIGMGLDLCTIALNRLFGFGVSRIETLEKGVNELVGEIIDTNEPGLTQQKIEIALKQIRGEDYEVQRYDLKGC